MTGIWGPMVGSSRSAESRCSANLTMRRSTPRRRDGPARSRRTSPSRSWRTTPSTSGSVARTCPRPTTRVTVDGDGAIHVSIDEKNNVEGVKRLRHKLDGMLSKLGMHEHHLLDRSLYLHKSMPIGATAHQAGTVRFGTDPAASALDVNCKAHDVDNLYVVDTSFFPSIGAVNPSLTAIANALRVGDHIIERLR